MHSRSECLRMLKSLIARNVGRRSGTTYESRLGIVQNFVHVSVLHQIFNCIDMRQEHAPTAYASYPKIFEHLVACLTSADSRCIFIVLVTYWSIACKASHWKHFLEVCKIYVKSLIACHFFCRSQKKTMSSFGRVNTETRMRGKLSVSRKLEEDAPNAPKVIRTLIKESVPDTVDAIVTQDSTTRIPKWRITFKIKSKVLRTLACLD